MATQLGITDFLKTLPERCMFDVRTPAEYVKGHIPAALNLPLFSNEERVVIGTIYKQSSPEKAMLKGLEFVGPKMRYFVETAAEMADGKTMAVHCWRGGKRSQSMAWLLNMSGHDVVTLRGGYKTYRNYVLRQFAERPLKIVVLGGRTGCGKTRILHALREAGEQVIDLEGIANHKGSAFGWIGEQHQPTVEHFENLLFEAFRQIDPNRRVWVENESKGVGRCYVPDGFWMQMKNAPLINIEFPFAERLDHLVEVYCNESVEDLFTSFQKIKKRLGGQNLKEAEAALHERDFKTAGAIALRYYDKTYQYNLEKSKAPEIHMLPLEKIEPTDNARQLIDFCQQHDIHL
ncbi:MAG: tRNA 2-selenouridine(34) synthase MnmH [Bacteroidota bacterium]